MTTTAEYLTELVNQKNSLADILTEKGVEADKSEKFNTLIPKVAEIQGGGGEVERLYKAMIERNVSELNQTSLPDDTTAIAPYAFYGCSNLALTKLPKSLTSIGNYSFFNCKNITISEIPQNVTAIGYHTFRGCASITNITALGLKEIGYECLTAMSINTLYAPNCEIVDYSFIAGSIKKITLGTLTNTHASSFRLCTNLEQLYVGEGTTASLYLQQCKSLTVDSAIDICLKYANMTGKTAPKFTISEETKNRIDEHSAETGENVRELYGSILDEKNIEHNLYD